MFLLILHQFSSLILAVCVNMAAPFGTTAAARAAEQSGLAALARVVSSAVFSWFISMSSRYSDTGP